MTVSILMVRALVGAVERSGGSRDHMLQEARVAPQLLEDSTARLSREAFERVKLAALSVAGDDALGLHIAEDPNPGRFDIIEYLTSLAETLRQSLDSVTRFSRLVSDHDTTILHEAGDTAVVRVVIGQGDAAGFRLMAELATSGLMRLLRRFAGAHARPRRVFFEYPSPAYHREYDRYFEGIQCFEQAFTGFEFDRTWLDRTQLYKNASLFTALKARAEIALNRLHRDGGLAERVTGLLAECDPARMPSMGDIARELGMSERSLRRHLASEGAPYKDLVKAAMSRVAKDLLERSSGSAIHDAASAMGFATPSAFHRAFKRWTGMTPNQYMSSS